jgi:hypothetical protein
MELRTRLSELAINDRGFVFDPISGLSFSVNATGRFLLEQLKAGAEPAGLPQQLMRSFDVPPGEDPARDVREFLRLLREQGLYAEASAP